MQMPAGLTSGPQMLAEDSLGPSVLRPRPCLRLGSCPSKHATISQRVVPSSLPCTSAPQAPRPPGPRPTCPIPPSRLLSQGLLPHSAVPATPWASIALLTHHQSLSSHHLISSPSLQPTPSHHPCQGCLPKEELR